MSKRPAKSVKQVQSNRLRGLGVLAIGTTLAITASTAVADTGPSQPNARNVEKMERTNVRPLAFQKGSVEQRTSRHISTQGTSYVVSSGIIVKAPKGGEYLPKLAQLGGTKAKVPMKHGGYVVNGNEIGRHVLATQHGNLNVPVRISMSCPQGTAVSWLSYRIPGHHKQVAIIQGPTKAKSYAKKIDIQPFTAKEFGKACYQALGGDWVSGNGGHNNSQKVVNKTLMKKVEVFGACTGWANKVKRTYPVTVTASCEDKDWFPPVP